MEDFDKINEITKKQLIATLNGGHAHATLTDALHDLPAKLRGIQPDGLPYSIWQLVDHIRITQWDILKFSANTDHKSPKWPDEFWHKNTAPKDEDEWNDALDQVSSDKEKFIELLEGNNIFDHLPNEKDINLLREALLIIDHTSYHIGQIILIRRLLNAWPKS